MKKYDVVILTDNRYLDDSISDEYSKNVFTEDNLVKEALLEKKMRVTRKSWDDQYFDWSSAKFLLFRTTWDYFDRFQEFSNWLNKVSQLCILLNSEKIIRWNLDKHYFLDLQKKGVLVCETHFIEKGNKDTLQSICNKQKLKDIVLKPCISGAARETYKISTHNIQDFEETFRRLISQEAMMLQPFQENIVLLGEISMIFINGNFTHAVLKTAKEGDFRVQDDFGGTVKDYSPTPEEIEFGEKAVKSCPELPIYARVDVFLDNNKNLALAELELIEPELWFRNCPNSAKKLAEAISHKIKQNEEVT